jgi:anti-anti-sigma factor
MGLSIKKSFVMNTKIEILEGFLPCIRPIGRLDTTNSNDFLEEVLKFVDEWKLPKAGQQDLNAKKLSYLLMDFSECSYISSSGIRVLLSLEKKLKANGGSLFICCMSNEMIQILDMAGLAKIFNLFDKINIAVDEIKRLISKEIKVETWQEGDISINIINNIDCENYIRKWNDEGIASYRELCFSVGEGLPAESVNDRISSDKMGFFTFLNVAAFIETEDMRFPDFRCARDPERSGIIVRNALSFDINPDSFLKVTCNRNIKVNELAKIISGKFNNALNAVVISENKPESCKLYLLFIINEGLLSSFTIEKEMEFLDVITNYPIKTESDSKKIFGVSFELNECGEYQNDKTLSEFLNEKLSIINLNEVKIIDFTEEINNPVCWLFHSDKLQDADEKRIDIEADVSFKSNPVNSFLARRLYPEASSIVIKQLHGGYSASTYQVDTYDSDHRRLRPTVMKLANRAMITRESERCRLYSLPYIFNNSAKVLGTEFFGDYGALSYNFVGIGGEQTRLKWLTKYFEEWDFERLEPLFDKTFMQILKPWYGQPVKKDINLFLDHDPTLTFFPDLWKAGEAKFLISSDEKFFNEKHTGLQLINPYWFLKHIYPSKRDFAIRYNTSVCHGDLNMQNILLDQDMNVYLIDFSETKPRSIVSDFARLEAIFMIEHTPTSTYDELKETTMYLLDFYNSVRLDIFPESKYKGTCQAIMDRNINLTRKMRTYAYESSEKDPDLAPYYMALLEWILPIVCYSSAHENKQQLSMVVSGMLCKKVVEMFGLEI